jgi:hypothetical protein
MEYDWRPGLNALLIFGGMFAVLGIIIYLHNLYEGRRSDQLKALGQSLGYEFLPVPDAEFERSLSRFALCTAGHSRKMWNLLVGTAGADDVILFDYQFVIGGGKNKSYSTQTVLWLRSPELKLPRFLLRPEHFGDTVHGWIGGQDFDFPDHPEFSRRFLLVGDVEAAVRSAFVRPVLQHFEQTSGIWVEGAGDTLLFCRRRHRVAPDQIAAFRAEGLAVLSAFKK